MTVVPLRCATGGAWQGAESGGGGGARRQLNFGGRMTPGGSPGAAPQFADDEEECYCAGVGIYDGGSAGGYADVSGTENNADGSGSGDGAFWGGDNGAPDLGSGSNASNNPYNYGNENFNPSIILLGRKTPVARLM